MSARALRLPPTHPEGRYPMIGGAVVALLGLLVGSTVLLLLGAFVAGATWFASRAPLRVTPQDDRLILAPVDGIVESVELNAGIPSELGLSGQAARIRIGAPPWAPAPIRAPIDAKLASKIARPGGKYTFATEADDPALSRQYLRFEGQAGVVGLVFGAGGFAERTVLDVVEGAHVEAGVPIGHRRFGGWCDVYVQGDITVEVVAGQTMLAGETALAVLGTVERPAVLIR